MRILADIGRDDTVDRMTHCIELRDELERAVADLLKQIGGAVGNVHLGAPRRLVDAGGVALEPDRLPTTPHPADHRVLALRANIEIARSEEPRLGKECVSPCRSRWSP